MPGHPPQNFCFWPDAELEYEQLAGGLRRALLADPRALDAGRLAVLDGADVRRLLQWPRPLPLEEERARLLREVGWGRGRGGGGAGARLWAGPDCDFLHCAGALSRFADWLGCCPKVQVGAALLDLYGGLAANLVRAAGGSAVRLVRLTTAAFPGFRDHCVYG